MTLRHQCDTPSARSVMRVVALLSLEICRHFPYASTAPVLDKRQLEHQAEYLQNMITYRMNKHSYSFLLSHTTSYYLISHYIYYRWQNSPDPAMKWLYRYRLLAWKNSVRHQSRWIFGNPTSRTNLCHCRPVGERGLATSSILYKSNSSIG